MEESLRESGSTWLIVKRILFGAAFLSMAGLVLMSHEVFPRSDRVFYVGAAFLIFLSFWWKRLYSHRHHDALIVTAIPLVMFLASWVRHGPNTLVYGEIAIPLLILLAAYLFLSGRELSNKG